MKVRELLLFDGELGGHPYARALGHLTRMFRIAHGSALLPSQCVDRASFRDPAHEAGKSGGVELPCAGSQPHEALEHDILGEILR